ncbi:MAG: C2 family cysteine protease, partial [archaeon]|nr:C2 family cysteine protease [archaeon]
DESNGDDDREGDQKQPVKAKDFSSIEEYYQELRKHYSTAEQWEDPEFGDDKNLFNKKDDQESIIKDEFEFDVVRPPAWDSNSNQSPLMVFENASENLDYEFTIKRGAINDRNFLNAAIMLFKRREEFFENLILDKEHLKDNFNAGFVGFTFFINGEWKEITIDTKIFSDSSDKMVLSNTATASAYWLYLFAKAYAKAFSTYEVLTSSSICDYLVDFTGGWARMKSFSFKRDSDPSEVEKKEIRAIYDEILRNLSQKYLIGCMYYDEEKMQEDNGSSESDDQGQGDEQIIANSMYIVLDAQEYMGNKLIYLVNHWPKGKWTGTFSVDDESWEANKALAERLNYRVSQSDRTFWMEIHDWAKFFNRLYYCRIFPDTWAQFCIDGHWTEATSGGAPPKLDVNWYPERVPEKNAKNIAGPSSMSKNFGTSTAKNKKTFLGVSSTKSKIGFTSTMKSKGLGAINEEGGLSSKKGFIQFPSGNKSGLNGTKVSHSTTTGAGAAHEQALTVKRQPPEPRVVREEKYKMIDVEPRFFLNTQFKLFLGPKTKLIISLMQEDKKLQNDAYLKTAMMIIHCPGKNSRVWEIREEEVVYGLEKIKDIKKE